MVLRATPHTSEWLKSGLVERELGLANSALITYVWARWFNYCWMEGSVEGKAFTLGLNSFAIERPPVK